jgi:hypothetical protein
MGTGAFAPVQSRLRDCALISDSIASVLGVTVRRSAWLVFARWLVSYGFPALLFLATLIFCLPWLLRHIATRRCRLFPRRLAAFLFLVVTITITTIIIVIKHHHHRT